MGLAGWRLRRGRLNHDDDLARGAAPLDQPHRGCRVGERAGPVDHRSDVPGLDEVATSVRAWAETCQPAS